MKGTATKLQVTILAVIVLALLVVGGFVLAGKAETAQAAPAQIANLEVPPAQEPDNSLCLSCHSTPGQVYTFPNGETVSIYVDPQVFASGTHSKLACQTCHVNISGYPHPEITATTVRELSRSYKDTCKQCHNDQAHDVEGSAHYKLTAEGNPNTPVCGDCHNPHAQAAIALDANGDPLPSEHENIAKICSQCHSAIVNEYKNSVHGQGVFGANPNGDVPACNDCHGTHKIATARAETFRLNSPELCSTCHSRKDIMDKYGISTDVMKTYVADFHGTTITLFKQENPNQPSNKPVCYDCHGVHNISRTDDPNAGLQIKQNILAACQKCHPDASANFPTSWMSHYIASPTKFPLVFYVQWFYRLFIPGVLGVMGLIVLTDVLRKAGITRRRKGDTKAK